jgi:uncharacterized protein (DUF305 family)
MQDTELLQFIHKTAVMGIEGLRDVEDRIQEAPLRQAVRQQITEYQKITQESGQMLRAKGEKPKDPGAMARMSSQVMSTAKTLTNASASKIAEMVIQGNTMGITKGTKHLHEYAGRDKKVRALAEKLLETEQANVDQMKQFL